MSDNDTLSKKMDTLKSLIRDCDSAIVAYSGGVDSTFLSRVTHDVLADKMLAVTAHSETYVQSELNSSCDYARAAGIPHLVIETSELGIENFADNPPDRCYYCKKELYSKLNKIKEERHFSHVFDGSNVDDQSDFRPGSKAIGELKIRRPLLESGLTKAEIRQLSREMGLPTHDKPAMACLSSRFPYGTRITLDNIKMVEQAEAFLKQLGVRLVRVRYHKHIARIETEQTSFNIILQNNHQITAFFKQIGFKYITLDIEGYRTGSMNEVIAR